MDKGFKQLLLLNLLIVIELIPAILILNSLMFLTDHMADRGIFLWISVGIIAFIIINYLIWRCGKTGKEKRNLFEVIVPKDFWEDILKDMDDY